MTEELRYLLEKGDVDEMIAFLKRLTINERKSIVPELDSKRQYEYRWNFENDPYISKRIEVLEVAFFICVSNLRALSIPRHEFPENEIIDSILEWYTPSWFSDYFNKMKSLPYNYLMKWKKAGHLKPEKKLIAKSLPSAIWIKEKGHFSTEMLEKYPETLKEHIWYLFEFESDITFYIEYTENGASKERNIWIDIIVKYVSEGHIERAIILKKSLLAISNPFNKELLKWYATLFASLHPTPKEIFSYQNELVNVFSCNGIEKELLAILCNEVTVLLSSNNELLRKHIKSLLSTWS